MADINFNTSEDCSNAMRYAQEDAKWANHPFGTSTIGPSGCGPTSYSIVCQMYGYHVTPDQVADSLSKYYVPGDGLRLDGLPNREATGDKFGVYLKHVTAPAETMAALKQGNPVLASHGAGNFTSSGHFMVYSYCTEDGKVRVVDPGPREKNGIYDWDFLVHDNAKMTGTFDAYVVIGLNQNLQRDNIIVNGKVMGADFLPQQTKNENASLADKQRESYKNNHPNANQQENEDNIYGLQRTIDAMGRRQQVAPQSSSFLNSSTVQNGESNFKGKEALDLINKWCANLDQDMAKVNNQHQFNISNTIRYSR